MLKQCGRNSGNILTLQCVSEQVDTKKEIIEALEAKYGIVTEACRSIGLSRSTFYDWLKSDSEFKDAVRDIQETAIDYVEGKLFQKISGITMGKHDAEGAIVTYDIPPSDTAIIFYLKTKAKHRGYIERSEVSPVDPDGKPLEQKFEITLKI